MVKLYQGENCPCKYTNCERYGKCKECIAFHHNKGEQTYCEKLKAEEKKPNWLHNFLDFTSCSS